jgi:hypothetical protein
LPVVMAFTLFSFSFSFRFIYEFAGMVASHIKVRRTFTSFRFAKKRYGLHNYLHGIWTSWDSPQGITGTEPLHHSVGGRLCTIHGWWGSPAFPTRTVPANQPAMVTCAAASRRPTTSSVSFCSNSSHINGVCSARSSMRPRF